MKIKQIAKRISQGDAAAYTLGRFLTMRRLYSGAVRLKQLPSKQPPLSTQATVFPKVDPDKAVADLRRDAICFGFDLSPETARAVYEFSLAQPLHHGNIKEDFHHGDVSNGKLADGRPVAMAYVRDPLNCAAIAALPQDPVMQGVCRRYLGYVPPRADVNLYWSFAVNLNDEERRKFNQTIDYHIDIHDFNFCYAHFYITDCDELSGAHVMVKGSHKHKKFSWLLGSARKSDAEISQVYQPGDVIVIKGAAGTGFIEDTSCYHKAMAPVSRDRLLLQIRYH